MPNKAIKILITGASGFIGSCLKSTLQNNGYEVICIYNTNSINEKNTISFKKNILSESLSKEFTRFNPNVVVHCAGLNPSVLLPKDEKLFYQFNRDATIKLAKDFLSFCEKANPHQTRKFINLSSYEIYGNINNLEGFNEKSSTNPLNAYADSKAQSIHSINDLNGKVLKCINVICTNNFGPHQSQDKLVPAVFNKLINDEVITIHGDGSSQRTWTFVNDTCEGIMKIINCGTMPRYHLSSDDHISVIGVINSVHEIMSANRLILSNSAKLNWQKAENNPVFKLDSSWTKKQLNWYARTPFLTGLEHTIKYLTTLRNEK